MLKHLELKNANNAHDYAFHAEARHAEHLHGAFLGKFLHALDELFALQGVHLRDACEHLGGEHGDLGELHTVFAGAYGVADAEDAWIEQPHDVACIRFIHDGAVIGHQRSAGGKLHLLAALHMESFHAALELAGADAYEGDAVAVVLVHVGLDLEHEAGEVLAHGVNLFAGKRIGVGARCWGQAQELAKEWLYAEVGKCRAEEHGGELAGCDGVQVQLVARAIEQLYIVHEVLVIGLSDELVHLRVAQFHLDLGNLLGGIAAPGSFEGDNAARLAVKYAAEVLAAADGPVHGVGADAQHRLYFLHQIERVACFAVEFVDEGEDGYMAQGAYLEQLLGLRLYALGAVDNHHRGVGCHKGSVGVFRKVLVARGVQDVHAMAVIVELKNRRRYRDSALFLYLHPVGDGMLRACLALNRAGGLDAAGVEQ